MRDDERVKERERDREGQWEVYKDKVLVQREGEKDIWMVLL